MSIRNISCILGLFLGGLLLTALSGCSHDRSGTSVWTPLPGQSSYTPTVSEASSEGEQALKKFKLAPGLQADLWAAEPLLANPVAIATDPQGRWFVCETFRHSDGVLDIRGRMHWLDEELASQSVEERIAIMNRHLDDEQLKAYTREAERLRLVSDTNGDGKADTATVFADSFNRLEDGIAAGVLARDGKVYYANLPDLWVLQDTDQDGVADQSKSLHHGYGVRVGFLGHDLHGLRMGPDGKLYFSIGDRGFNVAQGKRTIKATETGAVLRCNPDGSDLEIVHYGLRNPQELAFDQYGNLFTGDNNSDGGDQARWVYIAEGGDSGWRIGWQFITQPNARGPWMAEKMDEPRHLPELQPAYILPPIANIGSGPSGLTYYPGTGLPSEYDQHFFLCDFRGSSPASGIHCFNLKPSGATFRVTNLRPFIWNILGTDVEFGNDSRLYVSDWVEGWNKPGKGRIYRIFDPSQVDTAQVKQTEELISQGMKGRSLAELGGLLSHQDQRVRTEAQFALVKQGPKAIETLAQAADSNPHPLARLHAIWGLGQMAGNKNAPQAVLLSLGILVPLLEDSDAEVRAQAAKVLGNHRFDRAGSALLQRMEDASARVRYFATMALGKLGHPHVAPAIFKMLASNQDQDPYLRHAGVMALVWIHDSAMLQAAALHSSVEVQMAALLAMRRLERPEISQFLKHPDPRLVYEAARAINDLPLPEALPALAGLIGREGPDLLQRRIINANFRVGGPAQAAALVAFAAQDSASDTMRAEAIDRAGQWAQPPGRDQVTGLWRPLPERDGIAIQEALTRHLPALLNGSPTIQVATIGALAKLEMKSATDALMAKAMESAAPSQVRIAALQALDAWNAPLLLVALNMAQKDSDSNLRNEATRLQARSKPDEALQQIKHTLKTGSTSDKQAALATLAVLTAPEADQILEDWMNQLLSGQVEPALRLDVLEAAGQRGTPEIKTKLDLYSTARPAEDFLRAYRECIDGGNAAAGRRIFYERLDVFCSRCHKINGEGGDAGPDLSDVATRQNREYLMESILYPNQKIAEGFETILVTLKNGTSYAGIITRETETVLEINSPEDGPTTIEKSDIELREKGQSGMPSEIRQILSKRDIRDLVEFLSTLK